MSETQGIPLPEAPLPDSDIIGVATAPRGGYTTFRQGEKFTVDESTFYPCTVSDLIGEEELDNFKKDGSIREVLFWCFTIDGHEDAGVIARKTSRSLDKRSHFPTMCRGTGGPVPGDRENIVRSNYVGRKCKVLFEVVEKGDRMFVNVDKVVPA